MKRLLSELDNMRQVINIYPQETSAEDRTTAGGVEQNLRASG